MAELTLQEVFGENAAQTLTTLTISKSDLADLTASANNGADALAVAIFNLFSNAYMPAARVASKDVSIVVTPGSPQIVADSEVVNNAVVTTNYLNLPLNISLFTLFTGNAPDPDDYS